MVDDIGTVLSEFDETGKLTLGGPKLASAGDRSTLHVQGSVAVERLTVTANDFTEDEVIVGITTIPGGGLSLTIRTQDIVPGRLFIIKDETGTASNPDAITINTEAAETIDGVASVTIATAYGVVRLYSDGTNLFSW
jgi:hypothetical protein